MAPDHATATSIRPSPPSGICTPQLLLVVGEEGIYAGRTHRLHHVLQPIHQEPLHASQQRLLPLQPEPALSTVALQHLPPVSQQTCQGSSQLAPVRLIHSAERGLEAQEAQLPQLCQRGHHTVM